MEFRPLLFRSMRGTVGAWCWLANLVLAAFAVVPGLMILDAWSMPFVIAAAVAAMVPAARRAAPFFMAGAAIVYVLVALPLGGGLEEGLFIEPAAPATWLLGFMFLFFRPGAGRAKRWVPSSEEGRVGEELVSTVGCRGGGYH